MRGQVYNLDGVSIFTMGGAMSHDRGPAVYHEERDIHKIWWPQEMITSSDLMEAQRNLTAVGNQVDLVLTHTVPENVLLRMGYYTRIDPCSQKLEALNQLMDYKYWFAGHMHCNEQYGKVQILYNRIVEYKKKEEIYKWVL